MKLITRDTDYALRALCYIATQPQDIVSVSTLVRALKMPRPFLRKLLQILHKKGVLKAQKGAGGGFALALPLEKLILADLMTIFQGPLQLNECTFKKARCPEVGVCPLRRKIQNIETYVIKELKAVSIASLLRKGNYHGKA